jgi:hypothetical protein
MPIIKKRIAFAVTTLTEKRLYKFRSFADDTQKARVKDILVAHRIRLSRPSELNDPTEGKPNFCLGNWESQSYLQLYQKFVWSTLRRTGHKDRKNDFQKWFKTLSRKDHEKLIWQGVETYQANIEKNSLILSLSANPTQELLWSHYSDSHRGIALVLDASSSPFGMALKVNYVQEIIPLTIPILDHNAILQASILTKRSAWTYEDEYRCVAGNLGLPFKIKEQFLDFDPKSLLGVIFGVNTPMRDKQTIIAWSSERPLPLEFWQASISVNGSVVLAPHSPLS